MSSYMKHYIYGRENESSGDTAMWEYRELDLTPTPLKKEDDTEMKESIVGTFPSSYMKLLGKMGSYIDEWCKRVSLREEAFVNMVSESEIEMYVVDGELMIYLFTSVLGEDGKWYHRCGMEGKPKGCIGYKRVGDLFVHQLFKKL